MPPAAPARGMTRVSAAAVRQRSVATVTCPATWTVASSTPAVSLQTVWRYAWSAAAFASPPEAPQPPPTWDKVDVCCAFPLVQELLRPASYQS